MRCTTTSSLPELKQWNIPHYLLSATTCATVTHRKTEHLNREVESIMYNSLPTYGPPVLRENILKAQLLAWYPSHAGSVHLITSLIEEYKRFWRLKLNYPHRRVVAPGPIMAVQRVHQFDAPTYFDDCMTYFKKFMRRDELAWHGKTDYVGTFETIMVYQDMYESDPDVAWISMSSLHDIKRATVRLLR